MFSVFSTGTPDQNSIDGVLEKYRYRCKEECRMARIPRIMITRERTAYHVMSRTGLAGYPMEDVDKDFFVEQVVKLSKLFFC